MSATVIVLADYRERRAQVRCSVTFDPLEAWLRWCGFWMGVR